MDSISVRAEINYDITVGGNWRNFLAAVTASHQKIVIIAPNFIAESGDLGSLAKGAGALLVLTPDGEEQKDFATVERLWTLLGQEGFGRDSAIVAIGGGATTDLAGFVAATWLRGIAWYAIPTTLAGMVDASVGGKTGINTAAGKNLVGSFYSPKAVCADLEWLSTLSDRDFSAGLAEVIKTGFIRDLTILDSLEGVNGLSGARQRAAELVYKSVTVKADVVSADFKEGKLREILNFGHTLGHAIEKSASYSLRHGEAVSIGLHYAALLSESELGLPHREVERLTGLLAKFDLPISIDPAQFAFIDLLSLMAGDKKSREGRIRFVGLVAAGEPGWIDGASLELLASTYEKILR